MAAVTRALLAALPLLAAGCDDLVGLGGEAAPLATVRVQLEGDLGAVSPPATDPRLRVALVWADQWQPEPFCFLPAETPEAQAVKDAGCPDNFAFMPARVAATAPIEPGEIASIELFELPAADVMVGDLTARIAYGSVVVFDDRDGDETLELRRDNGEGDEPHPAVLDTIYGASLLSMTRPDVRVVFREGDYLERSAFLPRVGCPAPPPGFSIAGAGGFTEASAIAAILAGDLPAQDPASCSSESLDRGIVTVELTDDAVAREAACRGVGSRGTPDYHEAEEDFPDLAGREYACVHVPAFGGYESGDAVQLVMSGPPDDVCRSVTHFVLEGCSDDPNCEVPEFDFTANPPARWPCPEVLE